MSNSRKIELHYYFQNKKLHFGIWCGNSVQYSHAPLNVWFAFGLSDNWNSAGVVHLLDCAVWACTHLSIVRKNLWQLTSMRAQNSIIFIRVYSQLCEKIEIRWSERRWVWTKAIRGLRDTKGERGGLLCARRPRWSLLHSRCHFLHFRSSHTGEKLDETAPAERKTSKLSQIDTKICKIYTRLYSETVSITTRPSKSGWIQQIFGMMKARGGQANPAENILLWATDKQLTEKRREDADSNREIGGDERNNRLQLLFIIQRFVNTGRLIEETLEQLLLQSHRTQTSRIFPVIYFWLDSNLSSTSFKVSSGIIAYSPHESYDGNTAQDDYSVRTDHHNEEKSECDEILYSASLECPLRLKTMSWSKITKFVLKWVRIRWRPYKMVGYYLMNNNATSDNVIKFQRSATIRNDSPSTRRLGTVGPVRAYGEQANRWYHWRLAAWTPYSRDLAP